MQKGMALRRYKIGSTWSLWCAEFLYLELLNDLGQHCVNMSRLTGFPPIATPQACVLILGTMPGVASLAAQQYYAHPRNAFWPMIGEIFDVSLDVSYAQRVKILNTRGIAVWDILKYCQRQGSLDSAILRETPNPIASFIAKHRRLELICFNGQKAEQLFRKYIRISGVERFTELRFIGLPSSSPAYASMSFAQKLKRWREGLGE